MRIVIYGVGNKAEWFFDRIYGKNEPMISGVVDSYRNDDVFHGYIVHKPNELDELEPFDYIVVATVYYEDVKRVIQNAYGDKYKDKVIHYSDYCEKIFTIHEYSPYSSVKTEENLVFLYDARDRGLGPDMHQSGKVYSDTEMDIFLELADKYYGMKKEHRFFLDVGANIGTTSIYIKRKHPRWKIVAVEPGRETYTLLRANCILNEMDDIVCIKAGLSSKTAIENWRFCPENPGASAIVTQDDRVLSYAVPLGGGIVTSMDSCSNEKVKMMTISDLFEETNITQEDEVYLWIDTQGFEPQIITGGLDYLIKKDIPLFQEFNPGIYKINGNWEQYIEEISTVYRNFIDCKRYLEGKEEVLSISEIREYGKKVENTELGFTNLFFIK